MKYKKKQHLWYPDPTKGCPACQSYVAHLNKWNIHFGECGMEAWYFHIGEYLPFFKRVFTPLKIKWMQYDIVVPGHERWACIACGDETYTPRQAEGYAVALERALHELRTRETF